MANKQKGYTILEVMLFLAISGALMAVTVLGMSGQQNRLRFRQSMEDIEFRIKSTLDNTDQGYSAKANNNTTYTCNGGAPVANGAIQTAGCVFVGREINMCDTTGATWYVASRVAPFNKLDYTEANATILTTSIVNQDNFGAPGGIQLRYTGPNATNCRVAALNRTVGSTNQRVPRYSAPTGVNDTWVQINDSNPLKLCFRNGTGTSLNDYAVITITQADVSLVVGGQSCE